MRKLLKNNNNDNKNIVIIIHSINIYFHALYLIKLFRFILKIQLLKIHFIFAIKGTE